MYIATGDVEISTKIYLVVSVCFISHNVSLFMTFYQ